MLLRKKRTLTERSFAGHQAKGDALAPVRHLLKKVPSRQVEICEARRKAGNPAPCPSNAAEITSAHYTAPVMRKMEGSIFRQILRITNLLLTIRAFPFFM